MCLGTLMKITITTTVSVVCFTLFPVIVQEVSIRAKKFKDTNKKIDELLKTKQMQK